MVKKKTKVDFLLSPWAVLIGVLVGIYIGIFNKSIVPFVAPYGQMYLDILKMCILPILIAAIMSSLGRLIKSEVGGHYVKRMIVIFVVAMIITSSVGVIIGLIGQPGKNLGAKQLETLGSIVQKSDTAPDLEINFNEPWVAKDDPSPLKKFFASLIPANIFNALSNGANLKVLFFSIMCGLAIGFIEERKSNLLFAFLEAVYLTFSKMVGWLMYALPFGLCGLIADQLSMVGVDILIAMTKFVVIAYVCFLVLFILSTIIIWTQVGGNIFRPLRALKEPIIISLATGNSLAAIPSTLTSMHENLDFEERTVGLLAPVGITICRFGPVLYFGVASLFITQLYQVDLGLQGLFIVIIGSVLAGMATAGAAGILTLAMLGLVLEPLGLPLDAVLVLLIVVDPITAPLRSLTNVYVACAATAVIIPPHRDDRLYTDLERKKAQAEWDGVDRRGTNIAEA